MSVISGLKQWRKSLAPTHPIYRFSLWVLKVRYYLIQKSRTFKEFLNTINRRVGFKDKNYEKLLGLKNAYKGKRCFIACTGPSLTIADLEALSGEYVFGMNSICMIHDKTTWKPDFFAIQDSNVFDKIKDTILSTDNGLCFAPLSYKERYGTPNDWVYFHVSGAYHLYEMLYKNRFFARFSRNPYITVYDGYTVTYSIMQLAIYMGFNEIYLIGCDCNYMGNQQHFIEHGHREMYADTATERMSVAYTKARDEARKMDVKIINSTRGGCLEVYPREQLEVVLSRNEKNKRN